MTSSPVLYAAAHRARALDTLTSKEVLYVEGRLAGSPPTVAARMAGMSDPFEDGARMEKDLRIRDAMEATIKLATAERQLTRDDVLAGLMDAVHMSATATELVAAWREIGKVIGAYEPTRVDLNITNQRQLQELDDAQLAKVAAIEGEYTVLDFADEDGGDVTDDTDVRHDAPG